MSIYHQPVPQISSATKTELFPSHANLDRIVISVFILFLAIGGIHRLLDGSSLHWAHVPVLALGISYVSQPVIIALSRRVRGWVESGPAGERGPGRA